MFTGSFNRRCTLSTFVSFAVFLVFLSLVVLHGSATVVQSKEVEAGTVITDENLDQMLNNTFQGMQISELLTDRQQWWIREESLEMKIQNSIAVPSDRRWFEATDKYADDVQFNAGDRMVKGYKSGLMFPDVTMDDPNAGVKLMYNYMWSAPRGDLQNFKNFKFLLIGKEGLEREQTWLSQRYRAINLLQDRIAPMVSGGKVQYYDLLFARAPYDIKGVGTFTIRYTDGRLDDTWAYLRSVRRTRRLTGGAWMDPIGGTDQLQSDYSAFSGHPSWFEKFELVGKRWVFALNQPVWPTWDMSQEQTNAKYPGIDLDEQPAWNPDEEGVAYEPRPVWVIEITPPREHPYGKKVVYLDRQSWVINHAEVYDKNGEFWKMLQMANRTINTADGAECGFGRVASQGHIIDFNKRHATVFATNRETMTNTPGIKPADLSLSQLKTGEPVFGNDARREPVPLQKGCEEYYYPDGVDRMEDYTKHLK